MPLGFSGLRRVRPSVAQACKMTIYLTLSALVLSCRTLETFRMFRITTLGTSLSSLMCLAWIKSLLVRWHIMVVFTQVHLLTLWSGIVGMLFPLALAWWEVCYLMSQQVHLSCLGVTCNFVNVPSGRLWGLHFLGKLPHLACWKLLQISIEIIYGFENKLHLLGKTRKYLNARYFLFLVGTWQETLELEQHCTTHQLTDCLVWSLSAGQIWL